MRSLEIGNCNDYTIKAVVIIIRYSQFSYPDSRLPIPDSRFPNPYSLFPVPF
ncbi:MULTISPECIES: hypothetical protein [unclassified Moorena]|uniref:hypothetical protein n=1 Tax=unclassified Moorena TaxID=2683338 RepID=UPI0013B79C13|nr:MULTISPECIES: hypothetical protein [unclassified Moorena]NER88980.1 hypothetical protein [Moorena sp. SIO3A2]NES45024.1 hypothetical protein [Moorena sp. SIO2C4]NES82030.1 hypothetical protein [Moorena sp. SIO2B7]